jgi:hypothetical protein
VIKLIFTQLHDEACGEHRMQLLHVVANVFLNHVLRNEYKYVFSHDTRQSLFASQNGSKFANNSSKRIVHIDVTWATSRRRSSFTNSFSNNARHLAELMLKKTVHIETQPNTPTEKYARRCSVKALYQ